ncbi:hypothetical protein FEM48_Zijuj09G0160500 [Ziziphus jujuba var. spinosa]|uniref:Protein kinase domain-containing protein n=1 Tax=Ziziphus jujuba var. spinosa TaxID=714518 RepID=A0A978UTY6_ZIZJJ|nr:hypothetical protein FEM48_Zijuj09G0160500 [Ziziphus jujuba var. spinosa]
MYLKSNSTSLLLLKRLNIGQTNSTGTGRYEDDKYDRIWTNYMKPNAWDSLITSQPINNPLDGGNGVPFRVISTAAKPRNGTSTSLVFNWSSTNDSSSEFYIYMYFAELELLGKSERRKFNVSWNGVPLFGPFSPLELSVSTISNSTSTMSNSRAVAGKEHQISIIKTEDSTQPPILNALEIYLVKHMNQSPTYGQDVNAIGEVKSTYQINKNWEGDPCSVPGNLSWEGLKCNYYSSFPRITSLNLTSSNLSGKIVASIGELSSLEILNLTGNHLYGNVSNTLVERSKAGSLTLRVDAQNLQNHQNLCGSGTCKNNKNIVVPIVASLSSALIVLILLVLGWIHRRKGKKKLEEAEMNKKTGKTVAIKKIHFSLEEILEITSDFGKVIGKGGFGTVYHGYMKDGSQVAVKMLSPSSSQGHNEFKTEAELLMRVHHRNLATFVGYCDDADDHLALIYEFMANGNLKEYLSGIN